jgi:glycosyltransferase involved in cell wall biosynthesis
MPEISVIIPVYNVEKVFRRCLESVKNQTFTNFECILVNDCSPDNSPAICDEYAKKDSRFRCFHKVQNEGLPKARKSGLDIAKGEFVFHLDSDDWIELNALELLYNKQKETNADIIVGRFKNIYENSETVAVSRFENKFDNLLVDLFINNNAKCIWGKLYKKTLFDNYIVPSINIGEDFFVNAQILSKLEYRKFQKIDAVISNYDRRTGMTSAKKEKIYNKIEDFDMYKIRKIIGEYLSKQLTENEDIRSAYLYDMFVAAIIPYLRANKNVSHKEIKEFYNNFYMKSKYKNLAPLYMKTTIVFLYYFGRFRFIVSLHYFVMNFAKIMKYRFVLKV